MPEQPRTSSYVDPSRVRERQLDARSLRGLAHPMRVELLSLLRRYGPATATGLADRLGERSGTTSWHLRQLAEHGFIEEVPDRGNGRERWWQAAQDNTTLDSRVAADPATKAAYDAYMHQVLDLYYRSAAQYLSEEDTWDESWRLAGTMSDYDLSLTAAQADELTERLSELIASYRRAEQPGDERVAVQLQVFPRRV